MREYRIVFSDRRTLALQIKEGEIIVRAPRMTPPERIDRFVRSHRTWIEKQLLKTSALETVSPLSEDELVSFMEDAKRIIPERVRHYASALGVTYGRVTIRMQRTRWGSCTSKGNLNFNCLFMLAPPAGVHRTPLQTK